MKGHETENAKGGRKKGTETFERIRRFSIGWCKKGWK